MAVPYGKYLLERKLAEGGMAEIFLGRPDPALSSERRSPIVVKRLFAHHSSQPEFVRMFVNEARLAACLKHPNIVDIFDKGEEDGTFYLAMEYIPGEDLRGIAVQADAVNRKPTLGMICRILIDMLAGLHYAHTLSDENGQPFGLVHRDISPQNVLVTYDGLVKVIDFGIAKATQALDQEQTQHGLIKGKYAYMSPEQTRGQPLDARSDVFSAGILLWELVTWQRLFKRATDLATLVAVTEEPAPPMSQSNPSANVPQELDDIVLKALSPEPALRFGSAQEFLEALTTCASTLGWDSSCETLGRYMRTELFADKLRAEARAEARASHLSMRQAGGRTPPRERKETMPLPVFNPPSRRSLQGLPLPAAPAPPRSERSQQLTRGEVEGTMRSSGRSSRPPTPTQPSVQLPAPASTTSPPKPSSATAQPVQPGGTPTPTGRSPSSNPSVAATPLTPAPGGQGDATVALSPEQIDLSTGSGYSQKLIVIAVTIGVLAGMIAVLLAQWLIY